MYFFSAFINACSSGTGEQTSTRQTNGSCSFQLSIGPSHETSTASSAISRNAIACESDGIAVVTAEIFDSQGNSLVTGRWPCSSRQGWLYDVPVGTGYTVYVAGRDGSDQILYWGERSNVVVAAGQNTQLGIIELIAVDNDAPLVQITSPADMTVINQGQLFTLSGLAEDGQDGDLAGDALIWSSDLDGELGNGGSLDVGALTPGRHNIVLRATNSQGATGEDSIVLIINSLPGAVITSPADGYQRCVGLNVTFAGSGNDPEDGALNTVSALKWASNIDGFLGEGPSISLNDLSIGMHAITLTVSDSHNATNTAAVQVQIHRPLLADTGQAFDTGQGGDGDYTIHPPDFTYNGDGTITDNLTGLLWQQHDDGTPRPWYIATFEYVNLIAIGPYSQWRLPSKKELLRIADYGRTNPAINTAFFPETKDACYWTDRGSSGQSGYHWAVDFSTGRVFAADDTTTCYIRAVTDIR